MENAPHPSHIADNSAAALASAVSRRRFADGAERRRAVGGSPGRQGATAGDRRLPGPDFISACTAAMAGSRTTSRSPKRSTCRHRNPSTASTRRARCMAARPATTGNSAAPSPASRSISAPPTSRAATASPRPSRSAAARSPPPSRWANGQISRHRARAAGLVADRQCSALRHRRPRLGAARHHLDLLADRYAGAQYANRHPADAHRQVRLGRGHRRRSDARQPELDRPRRISALRSRPDGDRRRRSRPAASAMSPPPARSISTSFAPAFPTSSARPRNTPAYPMPRRPRYQRRSPPGPASMPAPMAAMAGARIPFRCQARSR